MLKYSDILCGSEDHLLMQILGGCHWTASLKDGPLIQLMKSSKMAHGVLCVHRGVLTHRHLSEAYLCLQLSSWQLVPMGPYLFRDGRCRDRRSSAVSPLGLVGGVLVWEVKKTWKYGLAEVTFLIRRFRPTAWWYGSWAAKNQHHWTLRAVQTIDLIVLYADTKPLVGG